MRTAGIAEQNPRSFRPDRGHYSSRGSRRGTVAIVAATGLAAVGCGSAPAVLSPASGNSDPAATAPPTAGGGAKKSEAPKAPVSPLTPSVQQVGTEILRFATQKNRPSLLSFATASTALYPPGAECYALYSNSAIAAQVNGEAVQNPPAANAPNEVVSACGIGDLSGGHATVTGIGVAEVTAPSGTNNTLLVTYNENDHGGWTLIAKAGDQGVNAANLHPISLTPEQIALDVNAAFLKVQQAIPG